MDFISNIIIFIGATLLLSVVPGPDILFVITQGITKGRLIAIYTALGLASGCLIHTMAATFGISVIIQKSAILFNLIKIAGALYLLFLAYKALRSKSSFSVSKTNCSSKAGFYKGFVMNLLNPKVALFFLAFLPQFVSVESKIIPAIQMLIFGIIFALITAIVFSIMGVLSSFLTRFLNNPKIQKYINWFSATIFGGIAAYILTEHS